MDLFMAALYIISKIGYKILYISFIGSILGILILLITKIFDKKISAKWKYRFLFIPLIFLILPLQRIEIPTKQQLSINPIIDMAEETLEQTSQYNYSELNQEEKVTMQGKQIQDIFLHILLPSIWLIGVAWGIGNLLQKNLILSQKIQEMQTLQKHHANEILENCKKRLNIRKKIGLKVQKEMCSPCTCGIFRPQILVNEELLAKDDNTLENVFLHELAHYKRKDMLVNYILLVVLALQWYNPFLDFYFKKMRQEMELATDEMVLKQMSKEEKKQYGRTLISLLAIQSQESVEQKALCMVDTHKNMEQRIQKIKKFPQMKKSIFVILTILILMLILPFMVKLKAEAVEQAGIEIAGEWKPFQAQSDGENVPLNYVYGSGFSAYGGSLVLKEDGTYENKIGVYAEEQSGTYEVQGNTVILTAKNGVKTQLVYNEDILQEEVFDGTYVYFQK